MSLLHRAAGQTHAQILFLLLLTKIFAFSSMFDFDCRALEDVLVLVLVPVGVEKSTTASLSLEENNPKPTCTCCLLCTSDICWPTQRSVG